MPWKVEKHSGKKPYKIVKKDTGEVVGSSISRAKASKAIRAKYASEARKGRYSPNLSY